MVFFFYPKAAFKSIDIGAAIFKNAPVKFSTLAFARLEEKGVIFAPLEDLDGVESYSAIYKGEVLVQGGSAADLRKSLDGAWNKTRDMARSSLYIIEISKQCIEKGIDLSKSAIKK